MDRLISMGNSIAETVNLFLLDNAIKGTILLALGAIVALCLRRDSAATRHLVWLLGMVALLALPLLSLLLPQWRILPDWKTNQTNPSIPPFISPVAPDWDRPLDPIVQPEVSPFPFTEVEDARPPIEPNVSAGSLSSIAPPQPTSWAIPWSLLLPVIWALGCSLFLVRLAAARLSIWSLERQANCLWSSTQSSQSKNDFLVDSLASARTQLAIQRPVSLLIHSQNTIPMVWGVFHSRLLLPMEARNWHPEHLRSVLLHELAHIKRYDTLTQLLTQLCCALHWFNPLVWVAARRMGLERERACDDLVLAGGVQPSAYAGHLLEVVTHLPVNRGIPPGALAMARRSSLENRLIAVLGRNINRRGVSFALASFAMLIALGIAVPIAMLRAVDENLAASGKPDSGNPNPGEILDLSRLEGFWEGEKEGIKVEVKFPWLSEHQEVQWQVKRPNSTIGAEMSVVMKPDSSAANFVFRRGLEFEATQGRVTPGEDGTLLLEIIPNSHFDNPGYPAMTGLLLKRIPGRHARLVPRMEAARPLYQQWKKHAAPDGTIPGKFLEQLGGEVQKFLQDNPNKKWPQELLGQLAAPRIFMANIAPEDAVFLLDEVALISTKPIEVLLEKSAPGAPQPETPPKGPNGGTKLKPTTEQLLKWGEPSNGLRMALAWPPSLNEPILGQAKDFQLVIQNISQSPLRLTANDQFPNPRRLMLRDQGSPLAAFSDPKVMKGDWHLQPGEATIFALFQENGKLNDGRTLGEIQEETVRAFPQYSLTAEMTIEKAPPGAWNGTLKTGQTRGSLDVIWPKDKDARELYETWTTAARLDGKIPAGVIAKLGESVRTFIKNNPTWPTTPWLQEMLPRFEPKSDLTAKDAVALLDDFSDSQKPIVRMGETSTTNPLRMALEKETSLTIRTGTPLPRSLADSPWGTAHPTGLRMAWLLDSQGLGYTLGTSLKARILIHNVGQQPVVFRTQTWQNEDYLTRDARGKEIPTQTIDLSGLIREFGRLVTYRLAPGEFIELTTPGIGIGANKKEENWPFIHIGKSLDVKPGDEVTIVTKPVTLGDGSETSEMGGEPRWWLDHIKSRLERHLPFPPEKNARERLLYRVAMELFGTPPSREINDAFVADQSPTALDSLAERLFHRPGLHAWSGSLTSGPTQFRVLLADPNAAKKPRIANGPGRYNLGDFGRFFVLTRMEKDRLINEGRLVLNSINPKETDLLELKDFPLPDGYNTWSIAWTKDSTTLWIRQKGSTRSYDFSNPASIKETVYSGLMAEGKIPKDIHEALGTITNGPERPKSPPAATGR